MRAKKASILLVYLSLTLLFLPSSFSLYVPELLAWNEDASNGSSLAGSSSQLEGEAYVLEKAVVGFGSSASGDSDGASSGGVETAAGNGGTFSEGVQREKRQIGEETAGESLVESYNNLPSVIQEMVVEMDIVNTPEVQQVRLSGILVGKEERGPNGVHKKRAAISDNISLWTDNRIPYAFQPFDTSARSLIKEAMAEWMRHTCIMFEPKQSTDDNYLYFVAQTGCYSYIGMKGNMQKISIGLPSETYCRQKSLIVHEIGHAIGFWHEQSRPDRDDYIQIVEENIKPGRESQFRKYSRANVDSLGVPYDYNSIMHYPPKAFSVNNKPTIVATDPRVHNIGQSIRLTYLDILQANLLYKCPYIHNRTTPADLTAPQNNSFLIKSTMSSSCLANIHTRDLDTFSKYTHAALYSVSLVMCNASSPTQRWQWTINDSLLHMATYLCLARHWDDGVNKLVLRTCKREDTDQKWSCAGRFIKQAYTSMPLCVAAAVGNRAKRALTVEIESILDEVMQMEEEAMSHHRSPASAHASTSTTRREGQSSVDVVDVYHDPIVTSCNQTDSYQEWSMEGYIGSKQVQSSSGDSICSTKSTEYHMVSKCYSMDMEPLSSVTFMNRRWATCARAGYYINGFYHTYHLQQGNHNHSGLISGIKCCAGDSVFTGEPDTLTPPKTPDECYTMDWWYYSRYVVHEGWFICPRGMLLKELLLTAAEYLPENSIIKKVRCCRPYQGSIEYMSCYSANSTSVSDTGVHLCQLEGFQVAGMLRKNCNEYGSNCEEEIICCMQA